MKSIRAFFKFIVFVIVCLAGALQLYKLFWEKEIVDGPIPIKETTQVLEAARSFMSSKNFAKAIEICENILKSPEKTPAVKAEAILTLKGIEKQGVQVPSHPELAKEVSVKQLEGSESFFQRIKQQEIKVTGTGFYPPNKPVAQGRKMAKEAAKLDAWRKILEAIKGITINSRLTVSDLLVQDTVEARVSGRVRGAREVATRDIPSEQSVEVDMVISGEDILASLSE
ncbi:MAG: hypothetical protein AABZ60_24160 [Planctomycetota bacterium]